MLAHLEVEATQHVRVRRKPSSKPSFMGGQVRIAVDLSLVANAEVGQIGRDHAEAQAAIRVKRRGGEPWERPSR